MIKQISRGHLLKQVSRLDDQGFKNSNRFAFRSCSCFWSENFVFGNNFWRNRLAEQIEQQLESGKFEEATDSWRDLEALISFRNNGIVIKTLNLVKKRKRNESLNFECVKSC